MFLIEISHSRFKEVSAVNIWNFGCFPPKKRTVGLTIILKKWVLFLIEIPHFRFKEVSVVNVWLDDQMFNFSIKKNSIDNLLMTFCSV